MIFSGGHVTGSSGNLLNNNNYSTGNGGSGVKTILFPSDDLSDLLARQGLAKYTDLFIRHEVDLQTFATLTEQDLREIGIQTFGARKKLLLLANSKLFNGTYMGVIMSEVLC